MIKTLIRQTLNAAGYDPVPRHLSAAGRTAMGRAAKLTGPIGTIIDIGASDGRWTREARAAFPGAAALMFEAQEVHRRALGAYCEEVPNTYCELKAASDHDGQIHFRANGAFNGAASATAFAEDNIALPCSRVDTVVAKHKLSGPFFVKFDIHGHETQVMDGARETLKNTQLLMLETYTFANNARLRFWEMCAHLEKMGFLPAQVGDPMVRPADGLLWQMDLFFIPATHACWKDTKWGGPET